MSIGLDVTPWPQPADLTPLWRTRRDDARSRDALVRHFLPYARMQAARLFAGRPGDELDFPIYYRPEDPFVPLIAEGVHVDLPPNDCYADFNNDGQANILDFVAFQNAFVAGDFKADCNGCGCLNILQFLCFQQTFEVGCD